VELIGIVLLAVLGVLGVLGAALSRQLTDEFKTWTPRMIEWLIRSAVRKLPEDQRERFAEEWQSHIYETPGEIAKFCVALSLLSAPWRMPKPITAFERGVDEPTQEEPAIEEEIDALPPFVEWVSGTTGAHPMFFSRYRQWQPRAASYLSDDKWMAYAADAMQGVPPGETPIALRESVYEPSPAVRDGSEKPIE
jgi:hypothetical protein